MPYNWARDKNIVRLQEVMKCQLYWPLYFKWKIAGLNESQESKGWTQNAVEFHFKFSKMQKSKM